MAINNTAKPDRIAGGIVRRATSRLHIIAALLTATALAGCGEGGGPVSTPAPPPAAASAPTTTAPTPATAATPAAPAATAPTAPAITPAATFQTAEYDRSSGASFHNAIPAWQAGATGAGVTIGIVDAGIDADSPELTGRIVAASGDVANGTAAARSLTNTDSDHGTNVALIAAAARDNAGVMGIAYSASLLVARADTPGSCAAAAGCSFDDSAIAAGISRAVAGGAKVINLSLGGNAPTAVVTRAVTAAAAAGVVVVVAAGNDATANADAFAAGLVAAGNGNVIVAGSVDGQGVISSFSNRAGTGAAAYLAALGDQICCAYANGSVQVTTKADGKQYITVFSGTSFSAPQIAGAAALLIQAFPRLTATQVVQLLLTTARTGGTATGGAMVGTDATYGHGILDIAAAFAPQGKTTLSTAGAGNSTIAMALGDTSAATSPAMGDAMQHASLATVVLDAYGRAYHVNLAANARGAQVTPKLTNALSQPVRQISVGGPQLALAFSVDARARAAALPWAGQLNLQREDAGAAKVLAAQIVGRLSARTSFAFALRQGADGVVASLQGAPQPAFLIAADPLGDVGFVRQGQGAVALRHGLGKWGLTVSAESGGAVTAAPWRQTGDPVSHAATGATMRYGAAVDRHFGGLDTMLSASWLAESRTVLGARFHDALGARGADSLFVDARLGWQASGWHLGAAWRQGMTQVRSGGLIAGAARLASNAWSVDAVHGGVMVLGDSLSLRVSQPLRVASGGLSFNLPVDYSYDTGAATYGVRTLSLAPTGREVNGEIAWRAPVGRGSASASLFYRRNPGNYASLPDDKGVAMGWRGAF